MKYAIVIEKGPTSYGVTVPDLPGCFAVGESREEAERLIREAIPLHIQALRDEGLPVPRRVTDVAVVDVGAVPRSSRPVTR